MSDILGTIGVFLILLAYFLSVFKKITQDQKIYILMNLFGGIMACISSILLKSVPFTILEGTWAIVSFFALFRKNTK